MHTIIQKIHRSSRLLHAMLTTQFVYNFWWFHLFTRITENFLRVNSWSFYECGPQHTYPYAFCCGKRDRHELLRVNQSPITQDMFYHSILRLTHRLRQTQPESGGGGDTFPLIGRQTDGHLGKYWLVVSENVRRSSFVWSFIFFIINLT